MTYCTLSQPLVLPPVRSRPRGQPVPQRRATIRVRRCDVVLLARIRAEIVELVGTRPQIEDVLPVVFADAQLEFVLRDIKIRARRMAYVEHTAALPVWRGRQACEIRQRWRDVDMPADDRRLLRSLEAAREPEEQRHVDVLFVRRAALQITVLRIAERLSVTADERDDRVVCESRLAHAC